MAKLVVFLVAFVLLAPGAWADLQPLDITAVSAELTIDVPGHTLIAVPGVGSASTGGVIDDPGNFVGSVAASVTVQQDRIDFVLTLSASSIADPNTYAGAVKVNADLVVDFDLPNVGGPLAPVYTDPVDVVEDGVGFHPAKAGANTWYGSFPHPQSAILGGQVAAPNTLLHYDEGYYAAGGYMLFPEGDSIRLPVIIKTEARTTTGSDVSLNFSFSLRFRTAAPSPFLGDLNADESIDIVDSTLLRRYLVGLPMP